MKYYVVSDVHGFFTPLKNALTKKGFFDDSEPHKLLVCGDLFDRGKEACELQDFITELMRKDEVILIRGNHEELMREMMQNWDTWGNSGIAYSHHMTNGTFGTLRQLTGTRLSQLDYEPDRVRARMMNTPYMKKILPYSIDFFETEHYVFVHGWIPCRQYKSVSGKYIYEPIHDWRSADKEAWDAARWYNGMEAAHCGVTEPDKTVVCGHYHCSFGHAVYEGNGSEFESDADFSPYFSNGIIAIDACTAVSHMVNCIVIED